MRNSLAAASKTIKEKAVGAQVTGPRPDKVRVCPLFQKRGQAWFNRALGSTLKKKKKKKAFPGLWKFVGAEEISIVEILYTENANLNFASSNFAREARATPGRRKKKRGEPKRRNHPTRPSFFLSTRDGEDEADGEKVDRWQGEWSARPRARAPRFGSR